MLKLLTRLALAKKAWDWYTSHKKNSSNQSGGSINRLGD